MMFCDAFPHLAGRQLAMKNIVADVSRESGVDADAIMSTDRTAMAAAARQYAMWKARKAGMSYQQIGDFFRRHHSTVIHAYQTIEGRMSDAARGEL